MTKVEELRRIVVNAWEQHLIRDCEYALANEVHDTVNRLISAAHAEGVAEGAAVGVSAARRQLMAASASVTKQEGTRSINGVRHYLIPVRAFSVPIAAVLAPTAQMEIHGKTRGQPSQALLDELSEICGDKVTYEPSVLAPKGAEHDP